MNWFIFWIVVYFALLVILTLKHVKIVDIEKYLVNNRNTRTLPLVFTTLATFVGGGTSIGLMAMGYESGFAAVGIGVAYVIGFFICSGFASQIHETGVKFNIYSFPQFLNRSFTQKEEIGFSRLFSSTVSGINIFIYFFLLSAQFVGMASLLKFAFEINYQNAAIISAVLVIAYTAFAGMSGVILTDMVQFIVILIMIILIFIPGIYKDTEGLTLLRELPDEMLNGTFYGIVFLIALPLFIAPTVLVRMDIWQRLLAAKSGKIARRVSIISGISMLPFYILFPLVGMVIRLVFKDATIEPKDVTYMFLDKHSSNFILGFAVIGLLSALMSSGDSFLNLISISAVKDFLGWRTNPKEISKNKMQLQIRLVSFVFGFIALFMALVFPKIVDLMVVGLATIVIFVPITLLVLIKKNDIYRYRKAGVLSILSGFIVNLGFFIFGLIEPEKFELKASFIPAFIVSALILGIALIIKKRKNNFT
ncbi:MAG: sodium:solute symporter family protein [Bacteroidales bacterium]|nr:sodium:solute symporter family protein [Bacteroidales bacterium]